MNQLKEKNILKRLDKCRKICYNIVTVKDKDSPKNQKGIIMNNYNSSNNNNTKAQASSGGIGFVGLLTIAFIVLRLCGVINWSWIWVLSPIWISAALTVGLLLIAGIIYLVALLIEKSKKSNKK